MTTGRYVVEPWWQQYAVYDQAHLTPSRIAAGPHTTQAEAQAACDQLNQPATPPPAAAQQLALNTDEGAA